MKRKQSTVILSAAMAAMMLMSGCGKDGGSAQQETATKNADGKYEPTLTITIAKQLDENTGRYGDGEDINNNPMTRLTEEKLGLKMETTLLGGDASNYDTKLRLALTGSEKLPDIFPVYGTQMISDMIESGQVKAIDDDIEKYMPDRLKEIYDKYPETFYPVMKDGKIIETGTTPELVKRMEGKVFSEKIPARALADYEKKLRIVNLKNEPDGDITIRYLGDRPETEDSVSEEPRLEDLYLWLFPQNTDGRKKEERGTKGGKRR